MGKDIFRLFILPHPTTTTTTSSTSLLKEDCAPLYGYDVVLKTTAFLVELLNELWLSWALHGNTFWLMSLWKSQCVTYLKQWHLVSRGYSDRVTGLVSVDRRVPVKLIAHRALLSLTPVINCVFVCWLPYLVGWLWLFWCCVCVLIIIFFLEVGVHVEKWTWGPLHFSNESQESMNSFLNLHMDASQILICF